MGAWAGLAEDAAPAPVSAKEGNSDEAHLFRSRRSGGLHGNGAG